jgi:hypothetical protein
VPMTTQSPLAMLVQTGLEAVGAHANPDLLARLPVSPSETVQRIAGGLLVAMGYKEIAEDLDLEAVALLGAAAVAGLQKIGEAEPHLHRLEAALFAFENLLRRTAPAAR